ncbi:histidinol dehydrogenase [Dongia mobilis]|uniref:Histidinol dehydrogenase n=1 Tax=Dongia mobilis TaxID=578943 RepID=A0A4R6WQ40_9PROT|nr:histidinol dehydrogenase [Dongia mobilis]TDQ83324.1 histidinol dehydrogenase [Dongia mobilis]
MTDRRVRLYDLARMDDAARARLLVRSEENLDQFVEAVKPIVADVAARGDAALADCARRFDGAPAEFSQILTPPEDFAWADRQVSDEVKAALAFAADNIRRFHLAQMPEDMWLKEMRPGVFAGERWTPIDSVACYVPRGKGSFPSVALMTAIPAVVAGVPRVVMLTPPGADGRADAATLVAARLAGVSEVYRVGGAQAVAAVAYGTASVPHCLKIVGPGAPYLIAAKKLLADRIDPGMLAGPSEALVLADETADGKLAALDLLVEVEHGPDSSGFLVTNSRDVAEAAIAAIPGFFGNMSATRIDYTMTVLSSERGGIVLTPDLTSAYDFVNDYAPEHLMIHAREPYQHLGHIRNAGEILLGENTSNTLANFVIGPNNVLPTSGWAKTMSPLSVFDYMKRATVAHVTPKGYHELAGAAECLARYEGFDAHANAVSATRAAIMKERDGKTG